MIVSFYLLQFGLILIQNICLWVFGICISIDILYFGFIRIINFKGIYVEGEKFFSFDEIVVVGWYELQYYWD